jgi:uncharacterized protein YecE (DUF72 family)
MTSFDEPLIVRLGALDWRFPAWRGAFYPADMPQEWQLTYFNTQYNCTFLEQAVWQQASAAEMSQWHADTHERFRFLLEADATHTLPPELADKALLISRSDARIVWFSRDTSLKELAAKLTPDTVSPETAGSVQYLISLDGSLEQLERVATLLEVMGLAT